MRITSLFFAVFIALITLCSGAFAADISDYGKSSITGFSVPNDMPVMYQIILDMNKSEFESVKNICQATIIRPVYRFAQDHELVQARLYTLQAREVLSNYRPSYLLRTV